MKEYIAIDQQRLARIRQSKAEQRELDRRTFAYVLALAIAIFILIVMVSLLTTFVP